jgi:hypothetical protein
VRAAEQEPPPWVLLRERSSDQAFLIGNSFHEPPLFGRCGKEIVMLMFYLPIIILEAMLSTPKRKTDKPRGLE